MGSEARGRSARVRSGRREAGPRSRSRPRAARRRTKSVFATVAAVFSASSPACGGDPASSPSPRVELPAPDHAGMTVEEALRGRRAVREYGAEPLRIEQVSQLLWAGQGITRPGGFRTAPSAGALYPLELLVIAGRVDGLDPGVYRYRVRSHALELVVAGDLRRDVAAAALGQSWVAEAPAVIAVAAVPERTAGKYGGRAPRYVHIEAGHAAQNLGLQAVSLGLGTTVVGAFHDDRIAGILRLADGEIPVLLVPVGRP